MSKHKPIFVNDINSKSYISKLDINNVEYDIKDAEAREEIEKLKAIGRFLSVWSCMTGKSATEPGTSPYEYKTGDYYIVGEIDSDDKYPAYEVKEYAVGARCKYEEKYYICSTAITTPEEFNANHWTPHAITNYRPYGTEYSSVASTVVETGEVDVNDAYFFDGTNWILQHNTNNQIIILDVVEGFYREGKFYYYYIDEEHYSKITPERDKLYKDITDPSNIAVYTCNGTEYALSSISYIQNPQVIYRIQKIGYNVDGSVYTFQEYYIFNPNINDYNSLHTRIDDHLSSTSVNSVQNKIVTEALARKATYDYVDSRFTSDDAIDVLMRIEALQPITIMDGTEEKILTDKDGNILIS